MTAIETTSRHSYAESDEDLLTSYVRGNRHDAFADLVRRHIDLVHGVASRSLGNGSAAAEDVTQAVFIILAKKAGTIRSGAALPSWLHRTTLFVVANVKKTAARRRHYENLAAAHRLEAAINTSDDASLLPLLDRALDSLGRSDRAAVVARYLEGASVEDVARRIGSSPDAVQKRLERAVRKLRMYFGKSHAPVTVARVTAALVLASSHTAPPALAAAANAAAANAEFSAATETVAVIAKETLAMMKRIKIRIAALVAGVVLLIAGAGVGAAAFLQRPPESSGPDRQSIQSAPAASAPTTAPADAPDDRIAIQGKWDFVAIGVAGRGLAPPDQIEGVHLLFENHLRRTVRNGKIMETSFYELDPSTKQIDIRDSANPARVVPGLYELSGDSLRINFDDRTARRPTGIPSDPAQTRGKMYVLKRAADSPAPIPGGRRRVDPKTEPLEKMRDLSLAILAYQSDRKHLPPLSSSAKTGAGYPYLGDVKISADRVVQPERTILVYDELHQSDMGVAVGFVDGHSEWVRPADFDGLLRASKERLAAARLN